MNISPFYELRKQLYSAAAAGTAAISENFRLKNAVDEFGKLSGESKVFGKLYAKCGQLFSSDNAPEVLADCIALADAVAKVQAVSGDNSETCRTEYVSSAGFPEDLSYSEVRGFADGIAIDEQRIMFRSNSKKLALDPRVLSAFIQSLKRSTMPESAEMFLPIYGKSIVPLLKKAVDMSDKKANDAIVDCVKRLAGAEENGWFIALAEDEGCPPNVRAAAVKALACDISNTERLMTIYRTGKMKLKNAALFALGELNPPEAEEIWEKLAADYKDSYEKFFAASKSTVCTDFIRRDIDSAIYDFRNSDNSERSRRLFKYINMLPNKGDAEDIFLKLAAADISVTELNQILILNIRYNSEPCFHQLTERLYAQNERFLRAKIYLNMVEDPETTFDGLEEKLMREPDLFRNIRYNETLECYVAIYGMYYFHSVSWLPVSEGAVKKIVEILTDDGLTNALSEVDKLCKTPFGRLAAAKKVGNTDALKQFYIDAFYMSNGRCETLKKLYRSCSPGDSAWMREKALRYALGLSECCPCPAAAEIMLDNNDSCPPEAYSGFYTRYVIYALSYLSNKRNHFYIIPELIDKFPLSDEEKADELRQLIKKMAAIRLKCNPVHYDTLMAKIKNHDLLK